MVSTKQIFAFFLEGQIGFAKLFCTTSPRNHSCGASCQFAAIIWLLSNKDMNAQELAAKFAAKIAEVAVEKDRQTV
jgi:hypothetical protein